MLSLIRVLTKWVRQVNYQPQDLTKLAPFARFEKKITEEGGMQKEEDGKTSSHSSGEERD